MAEEANSNADQSQDAPKPHGEQQPTDWEAKYRETLAHSRKWEQRAKDNSAAAAELEKLKESSLSEAERTAKRLKALESENAAMKAERQHAEWAACSRMIRSSRRTTVSDTASGGRTASRPCARTTSLDHRST
ncbi:hypothetical protein [Bifidobacterium catulorum]|uniref:Uncharacterized protein n=1 Tax=Bifidobacterium catulorum TaxID=1630173 RepID=A0A2U2MVG5_9BIFI|nr:hypothetical protein [Bifidobacterium catulorum]PWG60853.1 hypothetical protein DF200_01125 [Bifidobacterium catulorum]